MEATKIGYSFNGRVIGAVGNTIVSYDKQTGVTLTDWATGHSLSSTCKHRPIVANETMYMDTLAYQAISNIRRFKQFGEISSAILTEQMLPMAIDHEDLTRVGFVNEGFDIVMNDSGPMFRKNGSCNHVIVANGKKLTIPACTPVTLDWQENRSLLIIREPLQTGVMYSIGAKSLYQHIIPGQLPDHIVTGRYIIFPKHVAFRAKEPLFS